MAVDISSYRLLVLSYWKFIEEQAVGTCRRTYYCRVFDNHHFGRVDDHKIYFLKPAGGRYGLIIPAS
jgi:hypothetical protein